MRTISSLRHSLLGTQANLGNTIQLIERSGWKEYHIEYLKTCYENLKKEIEELREHEQLEKAR